jgi:[DsrC]-trisulfide reductase subunit J
MYDAPKVIVGILIFLIIVTLPIWYNAACSKCPSEMPEVVILTADEPGRDTCVMETGYMKTNHMDVLNVWRNDVIRDGDRIFVAEDGRKFQKSLTNTCMDCHSNKEQFCDQCHTALSVDPYCWTCHLTPGDLAPKEVE